MTLIDAVWHLLNLFAPAALTGLLATGAAKLLWRRELAPLRWHQLAVPAVLACGAATLAGLVVFGQDGRMATYAAMVALCAVTLWWRGWWRGAGRRR